MNCLHDEEVISTVSGRGKRSIQIFRAATIKNMTGNMGGISRCPCTWVDYCVHTPWTGVHRVSVFLDSHMEPIVLSSVDL